MDQPAPPTPAPITTPATPTVVTQSTHHSLLPWILLVIVLLLGVAIGSYFLGRQNTAPADVTTAVPTTWPTPEPIVIPDPTANWTAYETKNWDFKLPAPHDYFMCNTNPDYVSTYVPGKDGIGVTNHVSECAFDFVGLFSIGRHPANYAIPTSTTPDQNGFYTTVLNKTTITIDGKDAIEQEEDVYGGQGEGKYIKVYVTHDNVTDSIILNRDITQKPTFDQFLSTIKFK